MTFDADFEVFLEWEKGGRQSVEASWVREAFQAKEGVGREGYWAGWAGAVCLVRHNGGVHCVASWGVEGDEEEGEVEAVMSSLFSPVFSSFFIKL